MNYSSNNNEDTTRTTTKQQITERNNMPITEHKSENNLNPNTQKKTTNGINICQINARSVCNKTIILNELCKDRNADILIITETWLSGNISDNAIINELTPSGYSFIHTARSDKKGGGIAIIHRTQIKCKIRTISKKSSFECMEVYITMPLLNAILSCIYRPPPSPTNNLTNIQFITEFDQYIEQLVIKPANILIYGDFNIHMDVKNDPTTKKFVNCLQSHNLKQLIHQPSHVNGHILDLVIVRESREFEVLSLKVEDLLLSDHFFITTSLNVPRPIIEKTKITYRYTKGIDMNTFQEDISTILQNITGNNLISTGDIITNYNTKLTNLMDKHAPTQTKTIRVMPNAPWYTNYIKTAKTLKRRAERKWIRTRTQEAKLSYMRLKSELVQKIKSSKSSYYLEKIKNTGKDTKKLFSIMNSMLSPISSMMLPTASDDTALANKFAEFFIEKINIIRHSLSTSQTTAIPESKNNNNIIDIFVPVTEKNIHVVLTAMATTTCLLDPIPTQLLKACINAFVPIITCIVNVSLSNATMPENLKCAAVLPLLKKILLDCDVLKNYRPISNLPFISKVIEKCVAIQIISYITTNNLICKWQSAYRQYHSIETALICVQNDVLMSLDNKNCVALVLLDLSAAFDTIDHRILLTRLDHHYGIKGKVLKWIDSYLSNRKQVVKVNKALSDVNELLYGVPQGSVLGPLLFTMYTAPLGDIISGFGITYHLYADDTQLYFSFDATMSSDINKKVIILDKCMDKIKLWMTDNYLKLNDDKTEVTILGRKRQLEYCNHLTHMKIGTNQIKISSTVRDIGAIFDQTLSLNEHITKLCSTCNLHLRNIWRIRKNLDESATKQLIHALIISRLDNLNGLLYGLPDKQINRLQKIQNSAARLIYNLPKNYHTTPLLRKLHWLPIYLRIRYKILMTTFKCLNNLAPEYLADLLIPHDPLRANMRSSERHLLKVIFSHTEYGRRAFHWAGFME